MSHVPMAQWLLVLNFAISGAVLVTLFRVLFALSKATCVIGGENLTECMRMMR